MHAALTVRLPARFAAQETVSPPRHHRISEQHRCHHRNRHKNGDGQHEGSHHSRHESHGHKGEDDRQRRDIRRIANLIAGIDDTAGKTILTAVMQVAMDVFNDDNTPVHQ